MIKILRVGDPHVTVANLEESKKLIDFVIKTAQENEIPCVEFLGDLFHTHAVIRVEVLDFWKTAFLKLHYAKLNTIALVGNHDQPGSKEKEQLMNAMTVFTDSMPGLTVIDSPCNIDHDGLYIASYMPYMSNLNDFVNASKGLYDQGSTKLLICHQTFKGAEYSNGFSTEDGVGPDLVAQESIISGHIHMEQQVGKAFYPGTARWDTMASANLTKGIWIFEHEKDGSIISKEFVSTENVCTPIKKYIITEESGLIPELNENDRNYIELHGKSSWITKMKKEFKGKANIKTVPIDRKVVNISKEKMQTIIDYLNGVFVPAGHVTKKDIDNYLRMIG